jgi:hypothetical protein
MKSSPVLLICRQRNQIEPEITEHNSDTLRENENKPNSTDRWAVKSSHVYSKTEKKTEKFGINGMGRAP